MADPRKNIAMIKIATKQLGISDEDGNESLGVLSTYRLMLKNLTGKTSTAIGAMSDAERGKVIRHLKSKGFTSGRPKRREKAPGMASTGQIGLIHVLWKTLGDGGHLVSPGTDALNAWVLSSTKKYNQGAGYSAPDFLPEVVAGRLIESLKQWCFRVGLEESDWE